MANMPFLTLAFAALPKLPDLSSSTSNQNGSNELLMRMHLPPTPSEITEESELQSLDDSLQRLGEEQDSASFTDESEPPSPIISSSPTSYFTAENGRDSDEIMRQHLTLAERLQPFWSTWQSNRTVRLSLFSSFPYDTPGASDDPSKSPIFTQDVLTSPTGSFQVKISIPWERICVHPGALFIAFGEETEEHELFVKAELVPVPISPTSASRDSPPIVPSTPTQVSIAVPLTQSQIRLISDIDDTIKLSNILGGARTVFRNVFVRHLEELVIKGMGEWYTSMWSRGVRFHYVVSCPT